MTQRGNKWANHVRILCAFALLCLGLVHTPPQAAVAAVPSQDMSQYVLPDGTLPELCLPGQDEDGKPHPHGFGQGCGACCLTTTTILPSPPSTSVPVLVRTKTVVLPRRAEAFYRQLFPPNAAPRAPPSALTV